ncbi:MAG: PDZ domain-containing protein, partial [Bauldia sp.]
DMGGKRSLAVWIDPRSSLRPETSYAVGVSARSRKGATVGMLDDEESRPEPAADSGKDTPPPPSTSVLGLTLAPLTDELRSRYGFDAKINGVIVTEIDPASQAATKNIRPGDVITEAQQDPVREIKDVEAAIEKVKKAGGKSVLLLVEDAKGDTRFVAVPL